MNWLIKLRDKYLKSYSYLVAIFFTLVFITILLMNPLSTYESVLYDLWIRWDFMSRNDKSIVIVPLDEKSDEFLGENYPYTYASHARFINKLIQDKPAVIGYLVNLSEVENETQAMFQNQFKTSIQNYIKDGGSFRLGTMASDGVNEELPEENLQDLGFSFSTFYPDKVEFSKDDVARRAILNINGEDSFQLWIANAFRKFLGSKKVEASEVKGAYYKREPDATLMLFRYYSNPIEVQGNSSTKIPKIKFHQVLNGNFPPGYFKNKIVLVGPDNPAQESILTPFDRENSNATRINVHANIIRAIVNNNGITQVPDIVTDIIAIIIAITLSYWMTRLAPLKGLVMIIVVSLIVFILGFTTFTFLGIWFKLIHIIASIFIIYYIWFPFKAIGEYQRRYAIQEEAKVLKQVDHLKQNFISLMSHDLKTPVAKIAGIADLLINHYPNSPEQLKQLKSIVESTHDLNKFITSILDLTKIESQNLTLRKSSKDINTIIEAIVQKLKFEAGNSEVSLITELAPLYPISIDVELMNRVISNLVENAIKYSGKGSKVNIKTYDDEKWVWVEIKDNGIGISEQDLAHVFDKFYRVKNDSTYKIKGTGLGLYLVKYFIELHQGEITCTSKLGQGTTFTIKLKNA